MSVALVLLGATEQLLQTYRGDATPDTARYYLNQKDDLDNEYGKAQSALVESLLGAVKEGKCLNEKDG